MLWIEGHSNAWCYLSEIELLPSTGPETGSQQQPVVKTDDIETRANEIRKNILGFKPQQLPVREQKGEHGEMHYYIPVTAVDTIEIVDHRKPKSTMVSDVLMTGFIIALFAGGIYGGRTLLLPKKQIGLPSTVIKNVSKDEHAAKTAIPVRNEAIAGATAAIDSTLFLAAKKSPALRGKKPFDSNRLTRRIATISLHDADTNTNSENTEAETASFTETETKQKEELIKEIRPVTIGSEAITKKDSAEKKHNLFRKIFSKKKTSGGEEN